jgi:hypothetical protein
MPQTMPSGKPFRNKKMKPNFFGTNPKAISASCATEIKSMIRPLRFEAFSSETIFTPINLDKT